MSAAKENVRTIPTSEEEEQLMLKKIQEETAEKMRLPTTIPTPPKAVSAEEQQEIDARSVYIGNVDWNSTEKDIEQLFRGCGVINRITIPKCRMTGRSKGLAYAEFADLASKENALIMNGATMRGRTVKVMQKRTNVPGMASTAPHRQQGFHGSHGQRVVMKVIYQNKPRHFLPPGSRKIDNRFKPY